MHTGLFLQDFIETWNFLIDFRKILTHHVLRKSVQWMPTCSMRTDRQADTKKQTTFFRNFAKAPKKYAYEFYHADYTCVHARKFQMWNMRQIFHENSLQMLSHWKYPHRLLFCFLQSVTSIRKPCRLLKRVGHNKRKAFWAREAKIFKNYVTFIKVWILCNVK